MFNHCLNFPESNKFYAPPPYLNCVGGGWFSKGGNEYSRKFTPLETACNFYLDQFLPRIDALQLVKFSRSGLKDGTALFLSRDVWY